MTLSAKSSLILLFFFLNCLFHFIPKHPQSLGVRRAMLTVSGAWCYLWVIVQTKLIVPQPDSLPHRPSSPRPLHYSPPRSQPPHLLPTSSPPPHSLLTEPPQRAVNKTLKLGLTGAILGEIASQAGLYRLWSRPGPMCLVISRIGLQMYDKSEEWVGCFIMQLLHCHF